MISRKVLELRQDQACLMPRARQGFASRRFLCIVHAVKLHLVSGESWNVAFRNPSPWRQSDATLHLLPPFFISAASKHNFEREIECLNSQNLLQRSFCPRVSQAACPNQTLKFKALLLVQLSARLQVKQLVEAIQTSPLALFLVRSLARLRQPTNKQFAQRFAAITHLRERRFAPLGKAAFCVAT